MKNKCDECKYYDGLNDFSGYCKRNAPVGSRNSGNSPADRFPVTWQADWCGEFKAKEVETKNLGFWGELKYWFSHPMVYVTEGDL